MTRPDIFTTPAETEDRAGVERLDILLAERDALVQRLKRLRPLYGPLGLWGHRRKVELSRLAVLLRAQATERGEKLTEAALDAAAHAHPDYVAMVTDATVEAAEWVEAEELLEGVTFRINRGQSLLRYAANEPRT